MPSPLDRQNMNATVYSRKRPIEIVIISAVMVVLALVRIWAHFSDPSSFGRLFDVYSVGQVAIASVMGAGPKGGAADQGSQAR